MGQFTKLLIIGVSQSKNYRQSLFRVYWYRPMTIIIITWWVGIDHVDTPTTKGSWKEWLEWLDIKDDVIIEWDIWILPNKNYSLSVCFRTNTMKSYETSILKCSKVCFLSSPRRRSIATSVRPKPILANSYTLRIIKTRWQLDQVSLDQNGN